jgi:hypothetical protein
VWFDALAARHTLAGLGAGQFATLWQMVGATAKNAGFFSVWLKVFSTATEPGGNNLAAQFVADFAGANSAFPGTNTTNLP